MKLVLRHSITEEHRSSMASIILEQPVNSATPIHERPTDQTPPFPIRKFSVEEYDLMGSTGILAEDDNVELLEGWIVPKMTKSPLHDAVIGMLAHAFSTRLPAGYFTRSQCGMTTDDSEPEPDWVVVSGTQRDFLWHHPQHGEVFLVVEVSHSSLYRDRQKRRLYARAGVPTYWIVNIEARCVEAYTTPTGTDDARYEQEVIYSFADSATVKITEGLIISIPVCEFLPDP